MDDVKTEPKVVLWYRDGCPFCDKALAWINQYVPSAEKNKILSMQEKMDFYNKHNVRTLPQIYVDDVHIGGWTDLYNSDFRKSLES